VQALREAAFFLERCGLRRQLAIGQVAGEVEERERGVGGELG
jgi:hypothetical protein